MGIILALVLGTIFSADSSASLETLSDTHELAKKQFSNCQNCHGMPDPKALGGELWVGRVNTTACLGPKDAKLRKMMVAYLMDPKTARPELLHKSGALGTQDGTVAVTVAKGKLGPGSVVLVPEAKQHHLKSVRLVFNGDGKPVSRVVPAGRYRVKGYRLARKDSQGVEWQLWASGKNGPEVIVKAGESASLLLEDRVIVKPQSRTRRGMQSIGLSITAAKAMGATIVYKGNRVDARYQVHGEQGVLTKGSLRYG